jgi:hypothetical protein
VAVRGGQISAHIGANALAAYRFVPGPAPTCAGSSNPNPTKPTPHKPTPQTPTIVPVATIGSVVVIADGAVRPPRVRVTCTLNVAGGKQRGTCSAVGYATSRRIRVLDRVGRRFGRRQQRQVLGLRLNRRGRGMLRRLGQLPVSVEVTLRDGTGRVAAQPTTVVLERPGR